jgi:hypothetical protein
MISTVWTTSFHFSNMDSLCIFSDSGLPELLEMAEQYYTYNTYYILLYVRQAGR